jgi:flagellar biosynthesis protein
MHAKKEGPIKKAAALRYDAQRDEAPRVVARGRGKTAETIVALAREHDVPLVEDANLAQLLEALDVAREIPAELYRAVAEVLVFVYRLNQRSSS